MRIAVVTGASAGIGREFVRAIDREGAFEEIWVIARRAERLEELKQDYGFRHFLTRGKGNNETRLFILAVAFNTKI